MHTERSGSCEASTNSAFPTGLAASTSRTNSRCDASGSIGSSAGSPRRCRAFRTAGRVADMVQLPELSRGIVPQRADTRVALLRRTGVVVIGLGGLVPPPPLQPAPLGAIRSYCVVAPSNHAIPRPHPPLRPRTAARVHYNLRPCPAERNLHPCRLHRGSAPLPSSAPPSPPRGADPPSPPPRRTHNPPDFRPPPPPPAQHRQKHKFTNPPTPPNRTPPL